MRKPLEAADVQDPQQPDPVGPRGRELRLRRLNK